MMLLLHLRILQIVSCTSCEDKEVGSPQVLLPHYLVSTQVQGEGKGEDPPKKPAPKRKLDLLQLQYLTSWNLSLFLQIVPSSSEDVEEVGTPLVNVFDQAVLKNTLTFSCYCVSTRSSRGKGKEDPLNGKPQRERYTRIYNALVLCSDLATLYLLSEP